MVLKIQKVLDGLGIFNHSTVESESEFPCPWDQWERYIQLHECLMFIVNYIPGNSAGDLFGMVKK